MAIPRRIPPHLLQSEYKARTRNNKTINTPPSEPKEFLEGGVGLKDNTEVEPLFLSAPKRSLVMSKKILFPFLLFDAIAHWKGWVA